MIDKIKFNFTFQPKNKAKWLTNLKENISLKELRANRQIVAATGKLYLNGKDQIAKVSGRRLAPYLLVKLNYYPDGYVSVTVRNSLRKWFFNSETIGDFTKAEFEECLLKIAEKLCVKPELLVESSVTQLEYGANIHLREKYRCYFVCIHDHKDIKKKCTFGNETIEFRGENRSVIFYDKLAEQKGKSFFVRNQKKLSAERLILRYEIKLKKVSGCPFEKEYAGTLLSILRNWDELLVLWVHELQKITFVKQMNSTVYDYLKESKMKPMASYLLYLGMVQLGLDKWRAILSDRMYYKIRASTINFQMENYNEFRAKLETEDFEFLFKTKVEERARKLMSE